MGREVWERYYKGNCVPWETGKPSRELRKAIESGRVPVGRALEIGCGYGTNAIYLAERGFEVTAVDISPTAIERAQRAARVSEATVDFRVANVLRLPKLGPSFDFVFDRGAYHSIRQIDVTGYLKTLETVSRPGTLFLCLCGNANETDPNGPPTVTEEEIRAELGSLFDLLDLHEFRFDAPPGDTACSLGWSVFARRRE